jgi:hypothetical protein
MKKHLISLLVLFLLVSTSLVGVSNQNDREKPQSMDDTPGIQWVKHFGEPDSTDEALKVRQTSDGGYILVGKTQSYTSDGELDAWLIKTDKNGVEEWNHTYGEVGFTNWTYGLSVQQTQDGGYILVGLRNIFDEDAHAWVVKTTADGTEEWNKMYNSSFRGECIRQTSDGGYIISGESHLMDAWLCRIDRNGNVLWEQTFYEAEGSSGYSVQQTFDGGFIVAGRLYYQQSETESAFLIKTDADGNEQWNKTYSELASFSGFLSVQVIPDGFIIAGFIDQPEPRGQAWLVHTDELGNIVWNKSYSLGFDASLISYEIACTTDGGFILTGTASAPVSFGWILKTDAEGNIEWSLSLAEEYPQEFTSVQETSDGSFIVAGESYEDGRGNAVLLKIGHVPQVMITKPINALYLFDKERLTLRFPFIIGPITIEADAYDTEYSIERVEFIVDGVLKYTDTTLPYSWRWITPSFFTHTLTVTAYNAMGNYSSQTINVLKIF